ncbi:hypothetical protein J6590_034144 [Homalodisca vitripennis]|nr:hypothetical protein J6590_034144 [Homalodisca vitripennis]
MTILTQRHFPSSHVILLSTSSHVILIATPSPGILLASPLIILHSILAIIHHTCSTSQRYPTSKIVNRYPSYITTYHPACGPSHQPPYLQHQSTSSCLQLHHMLSCLQFHHHPPQMLTTSSHIILRVTTAINHHACNISQQSSYLQHHHQASYLQQVYVSLSSSLKHELTVILLADRGHC